jgi:eukaryotic-like serine/threonine-protein kinase
VTPIAADSVGVPSVAAPHGRTTVPPADPERTGTTTAVTTRLLADRYRLDAVIGHGGVGTVWRARDLQLDRDVAVKLLHAGLAQDPLAAERFRREALQAASLAHPALVAVFDVGTQDDVPYLVMQLVEGPSLRDVVASRGSLPASAVAALGHRIAGALGELHARGLVHRDVKPGNVLLSPDGIPRLVDLGAVQLPDADQVTLTVPGTMVGTIGYVAPEQLDGVPADARADVFSLGLVLHECLTGQPAFGQGTLAEMTRRRVEEDVPALDHLPGGQPAELGRLIARATERDPDARPADGAELASLLAPLAGDDAEQALRLLAGPRVVPPSSVTPRPVTPSPASPSPAGSHVADPDATTVMPVSSSEETRQVATPPNAPEGSPAKPHVAQTRVLVPGVPAADGGAASWSRRRVAAVVVALLSLAGLVAVVGLDRGDGADPGRRAQQAGEPITVADGGDVDPFGDGVEHTDRVPNAFDGDASTRWNTEGYNSPTLDKPGVGMWVRTADGATVSRVEIDLAIPGADVEVYAMDDVPGDDPATWGDPIGTASDASGTLAYDVPGDHHVILVWFTSAGRDGSRHRAGITDLRLS